MAEIDLRQEKRIAKIVYQALARHRLKPIYLGEWEVHGPHRDMPEVFVGYAKALKRKGIFPVAIYPKAVYAIEDTSKWWDVSPDNRIYI